MIGADTGSYFFLFLSVQDLEKATWKLSSGLSTKKVDF